MATASTKIKNVNTGGKRGHNTNQGNPMFMTPAKPVMKKDKKTDPELESSVQFIYFKYIHTQKYMFTIKKIILYTIANTFTKDVINGWGCKSQQNFDNRIIYIYVMEELPT